MAKPTRRVVDTDYTLTDQDHDNWAEIVKTQDLDLSNKTLSRIAKETGRDITEIHMERLHAYYSAREMWQADLRITREQREQIGLIRNNSLDSTCSVFQRADRILTNLPIEVHLTDDEQDQTPAWNDGKNVTFNSASIAEVTDETVLSLHGLNYHEVAHLFFTPRIGTALGKWVTEKDEHNRPVEPKRMVAFNILEDCRAEFYLTTKYPSVRPFLIATVGEYLLKNPENFADNFVLLAGRRYFSIEARRSSLVSYARKYGEEQAKKVYAIISEYRTLVYPRDYTRGQELIEAFLEVMPNDVQTPNGCSGRPVMRNGKSATEGEQSAIVQGDQGETLDDLLGNDELGMLGGKSDEDTNLGNEDYENSQFNELEVESTLREAIERAKSNKDVTKKVFDTLRSIIKDGSSKTILGVSKGNGYAPSQSEIVASRLFGQELERIRIDSDPAWIIEKPTGKLNVRRAMNADVNEIGTLFDRWETGNDDYDMEACVLIDRSGSMGGQIGSACRSAWVIKRAIEKINGRVSVMTFGSVSRQLYSADEKASANEVKVVEASGGTEPYYALLEAERILSQSKAKTKLLFTLTDGHFNNNESDKLIERMKQDGVYTSLVYLTTWEREIERVAIDPSYVQQLAHGSHHFELIATPKDLVKVAKNVVRHQMKGNK